MRWMIGLAVAGVMVSLGAHAVNDTDIVGQWTVADGTARVELYKAADGTFEGKLCWLKEPNYPAGDPEAGKPVHDRDNPDKSKRDRPLWGLVFMTGFTFDGTSEWTGGAIYSADNGKVYKGKMSLIDANTLGMRGYIGVSLFGRTEKWTRYTEPKK